jgi:hypothetical protein
MHLNKTVIAIAMMVILVALAYSLSKGSLAGSLLCLSATAGIFILTRHRGVR